jgi:flagellum-specific ATP synthase
MIDIVDKEQKNKANDLLKILATYKKAEDLINIGAYVNGSNHEIDHAIKMIDRVNNFLRQNIDEKIDFVQAKTQLLELLKA